MEGSTRGNFRKKEPFVDYYELLGVAPSATFDQIKKAFRDIARIHHPDKGNPEADVELFKMAARAKKTLTTEVSRLTYNRKLAMQSVHVSPKYEDKIPVKRKEQEYHVDMEADLGDVMNGGTREITITPRMVCATCEGLGSTKGTFYPCVKCKGHGLLCTSFDSEGGAGMIEASGDCFDCGGLGLHKNRTGSGCKDCSGMGVIQPKVKLDVELYPGFPSFGHKVRIPDMGHCRVNGLPGDVVVSVKVPVDACVVQGESFTFGFVPTAKHVDVKMQRQSKSQNVMIEQDITLRQAFMGFSIRFQYLDGRTLELTPIDKHKVTQSGHGRILRGAGFPYKTTKGKTRRGNLTVQYNVLVPQHLDANALDGIDEHLTAIEPREERISTDQFPGDPFQKREREEEVSQKEENSTQVAKKRRIASTENQTWWCILN